jgi:type III restriction enzyme
MGQGQLFGDGGRAHGHARVISEVRRMVDAWRGFELGAAADAYPDREPLYAPVVPGEHETSATTQALLRHWFRREPHVIRAGNSAGTMLFKYWPHQRRLVETFVYLYEVRRVRRTEDLWRLVGEEPLTTQRDPWTKLGGQLATGSGKTKMMSLVIAWSYLNAKLEGPQHLGLGQHALLVAPGLFVRDRLFQDFDPSHGLGPEERAAGATRSSVFFADPVVPPAFEQVWDLSVYGPDDCPRQLDPERGALVVTNYHQLLRLPEEAAPATTGHLHQMKILFEDDEPARLESVETPLVKRFERSRGLLVLNDEAHHVWDETGHARFEERARARVEAEGSDAATEMAWIRSIRRLHDKVGRVGLQVDLSATLFEEQGASKKPSGKKAAITTFKGAELFRHTVVDYPLSEAIRDGIVKRPHLERVEVTSGGKVEELVREGQPNAWEKYRNLLVTGIQRWKKVRDELRTEGDKRKPLLFILCNDRNEAREVANYLTHGHATREDIRTPPTGYHDPDAPEGAPPLFVEDGRSTVVEIHIGQKEESNEEAWEAVRRAVNEVDRDEIPDGKGGVVPNPYNVVVSVMMLKEGWDVRNVKVIVPLRPCDSRTLTEQTLGRGLRKMHPPLLDDDGAATLTPEHLYVIEHPSFRAIIDQISDLVDVIEPGEPPPPPQYLPIRPLEDDAARGARDVRLLRYAGQRAVSAEWRGRLDVNRLPPLQPALPWMEEVPETEIRTWLKAALVRGEQEGQQFVLPAGSSFRDFDHVIETAYALPILRELRASHVQKNAVKSVVREFLERRTFKLPAGLPLSFDHVAAHGAGRIALANLARPDVMEGVRKALLPVVAEALQAERATLEPIMVERHAAELPAYQALKKHVFAEPGRTTFQAAALENEDERRVAVLLDRATDVTGWVYNHRSGVGYGIDYAWQGFSAQYFPDFVARAKLGALHHNIVIEVKGRLDDRDRAKAQRGREYAALLAEHDPRREPWHYVMLIENGDLNRADIAWWEGRSRLQIADLLDRHETLPLVPTGFLGDVRPFEIATGVPASARHKEAVPVLSLAAAAGRFGGTQVVETQEAWAWLPRPRKHDTHLFVAQIQGRSMEPGVPDGSWCLFRAFPAGRAPSPRRHSTTPPTCSSAGALRKPRRTRTARSP